MKFVSLIFVVFVGLLIFGCASTPAQPPKSSSNTAGVPNEPVKTSSSGDDLTGVFSNCEQISSCSKISTSEKKEDCYYEAGAGHRITEQKECCLGITNITRRDSCISDDIVGAVYMRGLKEDVCRFLSPAGNKDVCYEQFARFMGKTWCDKISNVTMRDDCYAR